jgi:hypothetical protein
LDNSRIISAEILLYLTFYHAVWHDKGLVRNADAYLIPGNTAILSLDRPHDRAALKDTFFSISK